MRTVRIMMDGNKIRRIRLLFLVVLLSAMACNNSTNNNKKIFRYNETSGIASLDPAFAKNQSVMWAVHQVYNTLVEVDRDMNIQPSIAKRWEISPDRRELTFYLRDDVFFHDDKCFPSGKGRKLTASDVAYSFSRILDKATASPGAWIFNNRVDSVSPFTAINDTTFKLRLLRPFQPVLGILSMQYCSIVPREAVEHYGINFRRQPVGTGPFKFVAWDEGQALVLSRNENYFEKDEHGTRLPYLDGIRVGFIDSKATEFLEFRQNRLDFINDIDGSFKDELLTKTGNLRNEWKGKLQLKKHPYLNIEYLGILSDPSSPVMKNSPLNDKRVRQAINYGLDRKKLMLYMRNSIGTPATSGFIPAGLPSFNDSLVKGYEHDPAKARDLLRQAGYDNSVPIRLLTIPQYANIGSFIANELKQVGLNITVEAVQKSLLLEQTSKSQAAFFRGSWIADYPDAENYLSVFYSRNPAPPNYTRYKNEQFDVLYDKALAETNDSLRFKIYQEMDRIIIEDAPVIPLWYDMVIHFSHNNIVEFTPTSLNMLELRRTKKL